MRNLYYLRTRQKLSQAELSRRSGVSQTFISELEANKKQPTYPVINKVYHSLPGAPAIELTVPCG